jgi:hypothetical protein
MSFERILELLALRNDPAGDSELTVEQNTELEELLSKRRRDQFSAVVRPNCCHAIQKYPVLSFVVNYHESDSITASGKWHIGTSDSFWYDFYTEDLTKYIEDMPEPEYCPFCGTHVPNMVRKNPPPPHVCRVTDGGYYCDTCKQRLNECICDPPSAAFEACVDQPLKTIPNNGPPFENEPNEP